MPKTASNGVLGSKRRLFRTTASSVKENYGHAAGR